MTLRLALSMFFCVAAVLAFVFWPVGVPQDRLISNSKLQHAAEERANADFTLVVLGTSLTAQYSWPQQLAEVLSACLSRTVVLEKIGVAGANSNSGIELSRRIDTAKPDLILIEFAMNDADVVDGASRSGSLANHTELILSLKQRFADSDLMLITTNPVSGWQILKRPRLGAYYMLYRDLAQVHDIGLADVYPRWLAIPARQRLHPDGVHPKDKQASELMVPPLSGLILASLGQNEPCETPN